MEVASKAVILILAGAVVYTLWRAGQGPRIFVVKLAGGTARARAGTVTRAFLSQIEEIAALHGITRGSVSGLAQGVQIRLVFSRHFPEPSRQQLRNWWGIHGWKSGKLSRRRPGGTHLRA